MSNLSCVVTEQSLMLPTLESAEQSSASRSRPFGSSARPASQTGFNFDPTSAVNLAKLQPSEMRGRDNILTIAQKSQFIGDSTMYKNCLKVKQDLDGCILIYVTCVVAWVNAFCESTYVREKFSHFHDLSIQHRVRDLSEAPLTPPVIDTDEETLELRLNRAKEIFSYWVARDLPIPGNRTFKETDRALADLGHLIDEKEEIEFARQPVPTERELFFILSPEVTTAISSEERAEAELNLRLSEYQKAYADYEISLQILLSAIEEEERKTIAGAIDFSTFESRSVPSSEVRPCSDVRRGQFDICNSSFEVILFVLQLAVFAELWMKAFPNGVRGMTRNAVLREVFSVWRGDDLIEVAKLVKDYSYHQNDSREMRKSRMKSGKERTKDRAARRAEKACKAG